MRVGRSEAEIRPLTIETDVAKFAEGSVAISFGDTKVICTAKLIDGVPGWMRGSGKGWLTAEYSMLPASTTVRSPREAVRGKQSGRTQEIQRLIGRSLRSVTDLVALGERTICIDCDVLQADGGTRTASISGAYVALYRALDTWRVTQKRDELPLFDSIAAISVGIVDGRPLLDLDYVEDVGADVDMNVVMTGSGKLVEVQATAEGEPFSRESFTSLLDLAAGGIATISVAQSEAGKRPKAGQ